MIENDSKKSQKVSHIFACLVCDYNSSKKSDYEKHLSTDKHKIKINDSKMVENDSKKSQKVAKLFKCKCGKIYKYDSGYYRHKKVCSKIKTELNQEINIINNEDLSDKDLILLLLKQHTKLVEQNSELLEVIKNGTSNTNYSHNTTNSHNKSFNLQFFLNETCKDAMNIMDFVDSIKLQLSDLEKVGEIGYVDGISNIIVKNLNALDVEKRPVHCTDKKREVLYIKDEDKWEKEDEEKKKLRKAIKRVASKNQRLIPKFKEIHPDCIKAASKFSDQYNKMIIESMGGSGDNDLEKEDKIIKNISKNVIIDKNIMVKDAT
uniref:C2H2-type domain-containing protein n=1 Tax=viral metagenome TaxID=1070528 RepID=A0A6C0ASH1_9ZZZZ